MLYLVVLFTFYNIIGGKSRATEMHMKSQLIGEIHIKKKAKELDPKYDKKKQFESCRDTPHESINSEQRENISKERLFQCFPV